MTVLVEQGCIQVCHRIAGAIKVLELWTTTQKAAILKEHSTLWNFSIVVEERLQLCILGVR
jgi:hypothetical protein